MPLGATTRWSMLPLVPGTRRSCNTKPTSHICVASRRPRRSSPSAPLACAVVVWGSSASRLAMRPILPVPHFASICRSAFAVRRSYSLRAEMPAVPASIGGGGGSDAPAAVGGIAAEANAGGATSAPPSDVRHDTQYTARSDLIHHALEPAGTRTVHDLHSSSRRNGMSFAVTSSHRPFRPTT